VPSPAAAPSLLADLTPSQRHAVTTPSRALCVIAAAGAGKTRVITRRIAFRVVSGSADERHLLALTFTRKAAGELTGRLRSLGLGSGATAGTFHAVAGAQLRQWWQDRHVSPPALLTSKVRLVGELATERPGLAGLTVAQLAGHIEWAKARLVAPGDAAALASRLPSAQLAEEVAALYQRYQHELMRRRLVDFDDLLARCADALEDDARFASAQRWRWRHLFVDEFQDLNALQFRLLRAWIGEGDDICVVGDPQQAIYGWNGSDPRLLDDFVRHWPSAEVVALDHNHRCSPQVVAAGAAVLEGAGRHLRSSQPDGPPPTVRRYDSDTAEARAVADQLASAHERGLPWAQMAVLVRTNAQIPPLGTALRAAGIPHYVAGGGLALDHPAVRSATDDLRRRSHLPLALLVADLAEGAEGAAGSDPGGDLNVLAALATEFMRLAPGATAQAFLSWLPAAAGDDCRAGGGVTLSSFHRAKGLEWEAVWLCGLEQGLVPIARGGGEPSPEERRLLYVAITRASRQLHCSWAATRSFGARAVPRQPSPWLAYLIEAADGPGSPDGAEWRRRIDEERRHLRSVRLPGKRRARLVGEPPDPALVDELRDWRRRRARASGVPPHVLLHDRTLDDLARARPRTAEELLAVPGVGPVKASRFGGELLELVEGHQASA